MKTNENRGCLKSMLFIISIILIPVMFSISNLVGWISFGICFTLMVLLHSHIFYKNKK